MTFPLISSIILLTGYAKKSTEFKKEEGSEKAPTRAKKEGSKETSCPEEKASCKKAQHPRKEEACCQKDTGEGRKKTKNETKADYD